MFTVAHVHLIYCAMHSENVSECRQSKCRYIGRYSSKQAREKDKEVVYYPGAKTDRQTDVVYKYTNFLWVSLCHTQL